MAAAGPLPGDLKVVLQCWIPAIIRLNDDEDPFHAMKMNRSSAQARTEVLPHAAQAAAQAAGNAVTIMRDKGHLLTLQRDSDNPNDACSVKVLTADGDELGHANNAMTKRTFATTQR